ncbi:hypothetical protein [Pluralibacter sp.]|uniref:hypothetical protein n=1 Tax=Pluralibacter sp. TaxID=1920032 RepID=UPI0025DCA2F8|nr:hypothetical protein [Pluralibacter sp.]MBV8044310.1 hypothetical protein [Pluralibacter sp.]
MSLEDKFDGGEDQLSITNCFGRKIANPEKKRGFVGKTVSIPPSDDRKMKRRTATPHQWDGLFC